MMKTPNHSFERRRLSVRLVAPLLLASFASAAAATAQEPPGNVKRARIEFAEHLFNEDPIMLRGTHAEARVTFTRPASWRILPGSKLHLYYSHSGTLLPDHSSLTVRVADASRSVRLDPDSTTAVKELIVPIDPSHLGPYNAINLIGGMHYTLECEDPFHPNLWTEISSDSYIEFLYEEEEAFTDLSVFPFPYFDPLAYPPVDVTYVLPRNPSSNTVSALARISATIAQDAAYRPVVVKFVDEIPATPEGNYILVGTPSEQPQIAGILSSAGLAPPNDDAGFLASVHLPNDRRYAALIATGNSGDAVFRAAAALVDRSSRSALVGSTARVDRYETSGMADLRDWQGFAPDRADFTLQDLGFEGQTVRGVFSAPIGVEVKVQPDARPVEFRQKLNIHYAYSALLKPEISSLEVVLNGISLHSVALNNIRGSESEWLTLDVPWDIYGPFNRLELRFHLYPNTYRECERVSDRQLWGTIYADSNFFMPRDHWTEYPDLGTFARWGFPFTLRTDLSESLIVLPNATDTNAIRTTVRLMNFLMKPHMRDTIRTKIAYADEIDPEVLAQRHVIFISPQASPIATELLKDSTLTIGSGDEISLRTFREADIESLVNRKGTILEALISPWNSQRAALVIHEPAEGHLGRLYGPAAPQLLAALRGAGAAVITDNNISAVPAYRTSLLGEVPLVRKLRYVLAQYWGAFLIIGLLAVTVLFAALRMVLRRHREKMEAEGA